MSTTPSSAGSGSSPGRLRFDPVTIFFMLGYDMRWSALKVLADGRPRTSSEVAAVIGGDAANLGRQLKIMHKIGLLEMNDGEDRRFTYFQLAADLRSTPGQIDLGFAVIKLANT